MPKRGCVPPRWVTGPSIVTCSAPTRSYPPTHTQLALPQHPQHDWALAPLSKSTRRHRARQLSCVLGNIISRNVHTAVASWYQNMQREGDCNQYGWEDDERSDPMRGRPALPGRWCEHRHVNTRPRARNQRRASCLSRNATHGRHGHKKACFKPGQRQRRDDTAARSKKIQDHHSIDAPSECLTTVQQQVNLAAARREARRTAKTLARAEGVSNQQRRGKGKMTARNKSGATDVLLADFISEVMNWERIPASLDLFHQTQSEHSINVLLATELGLMIPTSKNIVRAIAHNAKLGYIIGFDRYEECPPEHRCTLLNFSRDASACGEAYDYIVTTPSKK